MPTHPTVYATDSSEAGWAFTEATWTPPDIEAMTRVKERSRFKRVFGRRARASALLNAGLGDFLPDINDDEFWHLSQDFAEIPPRLLLPQLWTPVRQGAWLYTEHIVRLEAMGINRVMDHISLLTDICGRRVLVLNDSMAVVLALGRCRARSFGLLREVRRTAAVCLALGIRLSIRWIPSELNSADEGTRTEDLGVAASNNLLEQLAILHADISRDDADDSQSAHISPPQPWLETDQARAELFSAGDAVVRGTPSRSRTPSGLKVSPTASPRDVPSWATTPRTCGPSSQTSAKHRARTPPAAKSLSTRPAPKAALRSRVAPVADALARALSQEFLKEKVDLEALAKEILSTADVRALAVAQSSESEEEEPPRTPTGRARRPDQTVEMRLRQALRLYALSQNAKDCAENLSYLEEVSVGPQVNVSYKQEAKAFFEWATLHHLALVEADEIDNALVAYMNSLFFQGHQAWRGQKLLASIAFLDSSLGRNGARKIPRSWRSHPR